MYAQRFNKALAGVLILSFILAACGGPSNEGNSNMDNNQATYNSQPSYNYTGDNGGDEAMNDSDTYDYGGEANEEAAPYTGGAGAPSSGQAHSPPAHATAAPSYGNQPPADMFFQDYGLNRFIDTDDDHFSTFSLDVDTGSYTIARNYLNDGLLPPPDAIRTEEFLNYFPQGYPYPSENETFAIYIDGAPAPFTEGESYQMIRVGIQGYDVPRSERKDVALTFVIDVSGSMADGGRLELVKDSLELLVNQLRPTDKVGIIAYSNTAWVVLEPTSGREKNRIMDAIYDLYPVASTNAEAGLRLGYEMASRSPLLEGINRVVLLSDGVANVGETGPNSIWESVKFYATEGITLTTVGVGMGNYNDVLMEQLADNGEGFYTYVDNIDEAERVFVDDLVGTLQTIAMDAKIQVDFNPAVVARYRLVGYENREIADEDFTDNTVDAAEIGAGHNVTALYEIKLHPNASGQIATVYLRWQDPDRGDIREMATQFFTDEMEESFRLSDPFFQMDVLIAEFAEVLRESYWAENTSLLELWQFADRTSEILEGPDFAELLNLMEIALHLKGY